MTPEEIKSEIAFWEREKERCKEDMGNQTGYQYYSGYVDGMKEILSVIENGELLSTLQHREMMKKKVRP